MLLFNNDLVALVVVFVVGMVLGFFTHAFKNNGRLKKPKAWNLGFILDTFFGGVGALVMVLVAAPSDDMRVLLMAIVGGYLGQKLVDNVSQQYIKKSENEIDQALNEDAGNNQDSNKG